MDTPLCPICKGPVPDARLDGSWTTADCLHCGALLTPVDFEQAAGWQDADPADEPAG